MHVWYVHTEEKSPYIHSFVFLVSFAYSILITKAIVMVLYHNSTEAGQEQMWPFGFPIFDSPLNGG